ncbi:Afg1l [Symbiodinium necroappetens]|uniref:Afg1l protein n=1 Tax=Symbiodinium necroappetens TaxID=1628268 RepID=A0A812JLX1_9DINO|nr:Afg1l [Symbiodinium necroappetens]
MMRPWAAALKRSEWQQKWDWSLWALQALARQDELTQEDCTAGVKACGKALRWKWALQLLSWSRKFSIRHPWNPAISACALVTEWERALLLLRSMRHRGPKPSARSYSAALDALARGAEWARGLQLLSEMNRRVAPDLVAVTSVIVACGAATRWTVALQLFERASAEFHGGDVVLLGATAAACGRGHQWQASLAFLACGSAARLLNATLFGACLAACANSSVWVQAADLLQGMSRTAIAPGEAGLASAASAFSSAELWQQALDVLSRAEPQTGAWWGTAIAAAARGFQWEQALELYARMQERSISPNEACSSAVQTACVRASRWEVSLVLSFARSEGSGLGSAIPFGCLGPVLAACQHGALWSEALHYLRQAQLAGISGVVMRASAMAACAEASKWRWALRLLPALTSRDAAPNAICFGAALHACRLGRQWAASLWMLWNEMPRCSVEPDWVAFCAALVASERSHKGAEVLHLVQQLRKGAVGLVPRLQSSRLGERLAAASLLDQHSRLSSSYSRQIWRMCGIMLKLSAHAADGNSRSSAVFHTAGLGGPQLTRTMLLTWSQRAISFDGDYFNDVYKYDIATSMWGSVHTLGEAPTKRTDHSVVLFRDSLLVFGGFDGHNRFNDLRELHLKDKRWSQVSVRSQVPRNRFGHTAVIYAHSMYIFGGWDGHDTLQELFEYNISSNMWIQLPLRGTAPRARYRHTAVVCGDAMFTFGGVDKTQYRFPDLHEYNFTHRHWLKVATMSVQPSARTFHKTVVHEGYMYILGGFDGRRLNDMYRILLRTKSELQRCQKQLAEQAASSPPVPTSSTRPEDVPGSTGAVGDAQDAAQTLMPEDLWCWTRIDDQLGQVYTPRTGHAVVVWNHCFYLMGGATAQRIASQLWRHRSVPERAFSSIPPGLLRLGLAPSLLDEAHSVAFEAGPSQALAHLTGLEALEPDQAQQQVTKQLDVVWSSTRAYSKAYDLWKQSHMEWEAECARRVAAHEQRRQLEQNQSHDRKNEKSDFPEAPLVLPAEPTKPSLRSRGCYIWGQVGRGKTLLMDVFALSLQPTKNLVGMGTLPSKAQLRRVHFHEFIHDLHRQLHRSGGQSGLAAAVDVVMCGQPPVLCFDEFQITTIADASLLTPLFSDLLTREVAVVITSNRSPNELYKGGIGRDAHLPAFESLLQSALEVRHLDADTDYRVRAASDISTDQSDYILGAGANERLEAAFRVACEEQAVRPMLLRIAWGRSMLCQHVANGVAKFTFEELCGNPLSSEDYLALIRSAGIHTFVVSGVPQFGLNLHNEARRFTNFVDALYEQQCRLICSADSSIDDLLTGIDGLCSAEVESDQPAMGIGGTENSLRWHRHGDISFHSSELSPCRPDTFATAEADAEAGTSLRLSGYEQDSVAGVMAAAVDSLRTDPQWQKGLRDVLPLLGALHGFTCRPESLLRTDENARQNDIYRYDVRHKTWACIDPVTGSPPSARSGSKAVVCRDSIFFFGGYTKKDGDYFNDLFEFNIPKAHWTRVDAAQKPSVRTDHSCVVFEASLYIFGGFDGRTRFQDLHLFNTEEREWMQVTDTDNVPVGRFGHSAVVYQSGMFVFGGWDGHDTLDDLYEFSITTNQWYAVPGRGDVPPSRYRHSAVVHGCCMFVFGGVDKRQARFSDLCEFSFDTRSWSRVKTSGDPPSARTFHRACMYGGCMYILGGFDGTRRNDMYKIALPEQLPRDEKRRRRLQGTGEGDAEAAAEPEIGEVEGPQPENIKEVTRLRLQVLELQKRLEAEQERHLCKICYEREINTVILDCQHRAVCSRCLDQVNSCPLCRASISSTVITYNA